MIASVKQRLPVLKKPETTGGSYFVSNYPPFSFWSAEHVPDAQAALDRPPAPGTPLGLYVHIPFCRKRCHFCYFKVYTDKNASQIQRYMDAVLTEARRYAERAFLGGRRLSYIYFGGGTPSYLSAKQLRYLFEGLRDALPWDGAEEIAFECEPGTLRESKLKALRELGVTRLSLGVENFNERILEINNRAHDGRAIHRAYDFARSVDFPQINIDLIAGMVEETDENWADCIERTIEMAPDSVTIYQMEVPFNTTLFKQMRERGEVSAPVADWPTKRRWVTEAFDRLESAGYTVTSAYTAVRDPRRTKFLYRDELWRGADMLALGVSSFGYIGGVHYQNEKDFDPYVEAVEAGGLPLRRALPITDDQKLIRELVLQFKLGRIQPSYFERKFGVSLEDRFAEALAILRSDGDLTVDGDEWRLTRDALLRIDAMLPLFFEAPHREAVMAEAGR